MKIGVYSNAFKSLPLEETLQNISAAGASMVELGCGEESGFAHCNPAELLEDEAKLAHFKSLFEKYGVQISALSCHSNPVSPNEKIRELSVTSMRNAVLLAEKLGLQNINCFSGCPGDYEGATLANWVTVNWPMDYAEAYKWQWEQRILPFWQEFTAFARAHGVTKIALELHPGQCCYNPSTLKRLREACGPEIGVNLDLSHLLWQRMDPILVIRELEGMVYHMHAKDIQIDKWMVRENGLINNAYFDENRARSWNFRTVGFAHGTEFWRNVFCELRRTGYDYVTSIEVECEILSSADGLSKAIAFLKECVPADLDPNARTWVEETHDSKVRNFKHHGVTV